LRIVTGSHRKLDGLQISLEKNPIPIRAHTPTAKRVEMINLLISPDSSACAPTLATPISNVAPGIGIFVENADVHVLPTLLLVPKIDAHAL
jgi:hypothetical protein